MRKKCKFCRKQFSVSIMTKLEDETDDYGRPIPQYACDGCLYGSGTSYDSNVDYDEGGDYEDEDD